MTLSKEAFFPENGQPMICYYIKWLRLPCCCSWYKPLRGVDVLSGRHSSSLQPQEAAPHLLHPTVVSSEGFILSWEDVFHFHPSRQICFLLRRALLFFLWCLLLGRGQVCILALRALLPVLSSYTSGCGDSTRHLNGEVTFIIF